VTKIDFIYFDAGGGHRAAATALKAVIEQQRRPWEVRMVHLQELLDSLDIFRKVTGVRLQDVYNKMLAKGWTMGAEPGLKLMHAIIRMYHDPGVNLLKEHFTSSRPDMVVSLVPNFNRALHQSLRATDPHAPFVTILTDFADHPPRFWMEKQEQVLICGTQKAVEQARAMGHGEDVVFRVSGMVLRPKFYEVITADQRIERERLGLDPDLPTGLVLFGGHGSQAMLDIARRLKGTQLILLCGRNQILAEKLRALPFGNSLLHAPRGFLYRKARARKHQRSGGDEAPRDCRAQRAHPAAGALQRGLGARASSGHRAGELSRDCSRRAQNDPRLGIVPRQRGENQEPGGV